MKRILSVLSIASVLVFSSCQKTEQITEYTGNAPIYMSYETLRQAISNDNEMTLENPGKIFLYNNLILINEFERGIHIYDNGNPASPEHIAFISIPGNVDMAIKNGILYADSYIDLVAIDMRDPRNVIEIARAKDVLSYTIPTLNLDVNYPVAKINPEKGVVIGYEVKAIREVCENASCYDYYVVERPFNNDFFGNDEVQPSTFSGEVANVRSNASSSNSAIAGSMARFLMVGEHLYVISSEQQVCVFDVNGSNLNKITSFQPFMNGGGWGEIETLFTFENHLFIGSTTGMFAYNVSNSASPNFVSQYNHFTACDPVVANEQFAFVTLRGGNECGWEAINELQALDIKDIFNPSLITTFGMDSPQGLTIDNDSKLVFVCDGMSGLRVMNFEALESGQLSQVNHISGFNAYDVILKDKRLHLIGDDGLKQFSFDNDGNIQLISTLSLN
jgi:hypothetical protein